MIWDVVFGAGTYTVDAVAMISGPATFDVNDAFTGTGAATETVDPASTLLPGETASYIVDRHRAHVGRIGGSDSVCTRTR